MDGTAWLAVAMMSFVGTHLLLSHLLRAPLVRALGEARFLGLYSLIAAVTLGFTVYAASHAPKLPPYWIAPAGLWDIANLVMLLAAILLVGSLARNPAMPDPTGKPAFPKRPTGIFAITRHPMMWAITLWAIVHAMLIGRPSNLIVTGGIGLLALAGAIGQDVKKARLLGEPWLHWQRQTSFLPFAALLAGKVPWRAATPRAWPLIGGLALWAGATWLHPLAGGPVAGPWMWMG